MKLICDGISIEGDVEEIGEWINRYPSYTILSAYKLPTQRYVTDIEGNTIEKPVFKTN